MPLGRHSRHPCPDKTLQERRHKARAQHRRVHTAWRNGGLRDGVDRRKKNVLAAKALSFGLCQFAVRKRSSVGERLTRISGLGESSKRALTTSLCASDEIWPPWLTQEEPMTTYIRTLYNGLYYNVLQKFAQAISNTLSRSTAWRQCTSSLRNHCTSYWT